MQFSGTVATYSDSGDPSPDASDTAEIDWGDGQTSEGTLTSDGSGNYTVTGSNTYAEGGTYPITVTLIDSVVQEYIDPVYNTATKQYLDTEEEVTNGDPNGFQIDNTATVADAGTLAIYTPSQPVSPAPPTLGDASFEAINVVGGSAYDPTGSAWTFSNSSGVTGNGSGFTLSNPPAPQGSQVAFLQNTGSITQSVSGWAAGSYTISFDAAQRGNYGGVQDFEVLVDGSVVGSFTPTTTSYRSYTTGPFTVAAGSHTIEFLGVNTTGGDDTDFLDAVSVAFVAPAVPAVGDAGFEQVSVGNGFAYNPTGSAWTFSGPASNGGSGVTGNNSAFTSGSPPAPQSSQVAFLQEYASMSQAVAGWAAGTYTLSFKSAQRGNNPIPPAEDFQVLVDGVAVGTFQPSGTTYQSYTTSPFTVTAGSHTITFQGLDTAGGDNTAFLDDVTVGSVSSPGNVITASDAAPFDGMVAQFTDSDPNATPDKYTTSVDFGDGGGPTEGYVLADPNIPGVFDVYGDDDFFTAGTYDGTATITETGGTTLAMNFVTNVAEANTVAAAGDLPTIKITSRGSRPGDGTTTPTDIEGMKYTVGQKFNVPAAYTDPATGNMTTYAVASVSYSYPTTAVKGYGTFATDQNGNVKFVGEPNSAPDTTVKVVSTFTQDDQDINHANSFHFIKSFYWGPTAEGVQTISATAYFNKYINDVLQPAQVTATDSVQVNVLRPMGNINVTTFGTPGFGGKSGTLPRMGLDKNTVSDAKGNVLNGIVGIQYTANVTAASTNGIGAFSTCQTININETGEFKTPKFSQVFFTLGRADKTSPTALDTESGDTFLYTTGAPVGVSIQADDSPGVGISLPNTPISIYREDHFETTLIYLPEEGGIYIPVGSIDWGWGGNSVFNAQQGWQPGAYERWPDTGMPIYTAASSNDDFPTWYDNANQYKPRIVSAS